MVGIFTVCFFDPTVPQLSCKIGQRCEQLSDTKCLGLNGDLFGRPLKQITIEGASHSDGTVEDGSIANEEAMDSLSLDDRRDTETCLVDGIVLANFDVVGQPIPANWIADIERSRLLSEVGPESSAVQSSRSNVEPVRDVALHQLCSLLLEGHTREEISNSILYRQVGIFCVCQLMCVVNPVEQ